MKVRSALLESTSRRVSETLAKDPFGVDAHEALNQRLEMLGAFAEGFRSGGAMMPKREM